MLTNSGSSVPSEPFVAGTQDGSSNGTNDNEKPKLIVEINEEGSVVGENAKYFQTRAGEFVRALLPVSYNEIPDVPMNFKNDVWNALMEEFTFEIPNDVARATIEPTWSQKFRTHKNSLRKALRLNPDLQPRGIDPLIWKTFLANENDPKKIAERLRNAKNRKKLEYSHTLGRQTYAQKQHVLELQNPGKEIFPQDVWLVGHEHRDGSILQSAQPKYEAVKVASKKNIKDPMTVLGPQKKGGVRGKGSYITKKRLMHCAVAKAKIVALKSKQLSGQEEINNKVCSELSELRAMLHAVLKRLPPSLLDSSPSNGTPVSDKDTPSDGNANPAGEKNSTSHGHSVSRNLESMFISKEVASSELNAPIRVNLCDKFGTTVARGTLVTDATAGICHFKKVMNYERKVCIDEVLIPNAPIHVAPQGDNYTLHDYVDGGFIIWPECHINYI